MQLQKSKTSKIVAGLLGIAMALSLVFGGAVAPAQADTSSVQAQIAALQAQLAALMAQAGQSSSTSSYQFNVNLTMGSRSEDVRNLQKVLNMSTDTQVAASGAGSPGNETTLFGGLTKAAVIKFQAKNGISPRSGFVGALTRAALNSMGGGAGSKTTGTGSTGSTGSPNVGGGLTVTAAVQPSNSLAPQSASRVPFTKLTLTAGAGDVLVNNITVQKAGLADDAVFSGVVLLDQNGQQLGVSKTLNSNHQAQVGDPFTVKAGTSVTVTVAGNMAASLASYAGQVVGLNVVSVNTASATVSGSFPISGALHTVNATLSLGSATIYVSSFDPNSAQTQPIGTTGYRFSGVRIQAGSAEKVRLWSIRWNQSGSASSNDLANIVVTVDGTDYPTTLSADGKYYTAVFGSGLVIDKGFSKDIYVKGDIIGTGAANRTVQFDIYRNTDVYLTGETYGYGITSTAGGNTASAATTASEFVTSNGLTTGTASNPWFSGSLITISAGTVSTISPATSVPAQNIALNVPNQPLGGYMTDIKGEPITVQTTAFTVATTSTGAGLLTSVSIVDENGAVVAGPVDATGAGTTLTFSNSITYPIGKHTYKVVGKLPSGLTNGGTFVLSTAPSTQWTTVTGATTGNTVSLSSLGTVTMNTMTVRTASLAVNVSPSPASQTIVAGGGTPFLFANYQFDATQSGEDVRFSSLGLNLSGNGTNGGTFTNLTGCQLYNGSTALNTGSNVVNPVATANAQTVTLDQSLVVPKGSVTTLALKCNLSSSATTSSQFMWGITSTQIAAISATGVTSSASVTPTGSTVNSGVMTIGAGTLTVSTDASSPSYKVASAGTSNVLVGAYKFRAATEAINLQRIALQLTNTASSSPSDVTRVSLWLQGAASPFAYAYFQGTNTTGTTSTFVAPVTLPQDQDQVILAQVDLAPISSSGAVQVSGHLIAVDINNNDTTGTQGTGVQSGVTRNATGSTAVAGIRVDKSFPSFAQDSLSGTGGTDGKLIRFKITADAAGNVSIVKLKFTLSTTTATVTNANLYAYTDSSYSNGISGVGTNGQVSNSNIKPDANGVVAVYVQNTSAATTTIQIPAGQTRYFELRATVVGTGTNGAGTVVTTLNGDSAYPILSGFTGQLSAAVTNSVDATTTTAPSFIWSPNSTTSPSGTDGSSDWVNGYGLPGLPSNGLIQSRTTP